MQKNYHKSIWASIIILYLVWGSTYLGIRLMVADIPPFFGAGFRNFLAGVLVLIGLLLLNKKNIVSRKSLLISILSGFLMLFVGNGFITMAAKWVPSGYIAIFPAAVPIWLVFFDFIIKKKIPSKSILIGCLIGIIGVGLLINQNQLSINGFENYFTLGVLLILIATLGWSLGVFINVNYQSNNDPFLIAALQMVFGGLFLLIASFIKEENGIEKFILASSQAKYAFLYLLIFGSIIGFLVFNWVSGKAPATLVATYNYVNPIVAIFLGWLIADEKINSTVIVSCFLVLFAVFLISKSPKS